MKSLPHRNFGRSGETCTALGMGGGFVGFKGFEESVATVRRALELGVRFFDTSVMYRHGASQSILGEALAGQPNPPFLATKVGYFKEARHFRSVEALHVQLRENLRLLRRDSVDLLQVHEADLGQLVERSTGCRVVATLRSRGWIRFRQRAGHPISARSPGARAVSPHRHHWQQCPASRAADSRTGRTRLGARRLQLHAAQRHDARLRNTGRDGKGHGGRRRGHLHVCLFASRGLANRRELILAVTPTRQLAALQKLQQACGIPMAELALRFVAADEKITTVLVGACQPAEIEQNVASFLHGPLPPDIHRRDGRHRLQLRLSPNQPGLFSSRQCI